MRASIIFAMLAALAACGDAPDQPIGGEQSPAQTPMPVEPDGGIGDGAGPPDDASVPVAGATGLIPARFHGIWDYVGGTCAPESDLRMEISGNEILFYESIGLVTDVTMEGGDAVATLAMEGEGETWTQRTRLSLSGKGEGTRLSTSDGDAPRIVDDYPSKRCAS